jgi:hypothetical protein
VGDSETRTRLEKETQADPQVPRPNLSVPAQPLSLESVGISAWRQVSMEPPAGQASRRRPSGPSLTTPEPFTPSPPPVPTGRDGRGTWGKPPLSLFDNQTAMARSSAQWERCPAEWRTDTLPPPLPPRRHGSKPVWMGREVRGPGQPSGCRALESSSILKSSSFHLIRCSGRNTNKQKASKTHRSRSPSRRALPPSTASQELAGANRSPICSGQVTCGTFRTRNSGRFSRSPADASIHIDV